MITSISFNEILPIWKMFLWPNRTSPIETTSAMNLLSGYDLQNMIHPPTFLAYMIDNKIAGVNSGHKCADNSYRSRGLWVFPQYRKQGVGTDILKATILQGKKEGATHVWSYPRFSSWTTYQAAGFNLVSDWETSETSDRNAFCRIDI